MTRENVLAMIDSTGIRREADFVVPINGSPVNLPYLIVRTKETVTGSDNGMVCVLKTEWGISLFTINRDILLETALLKALCGVGKVEIIRYPDGQPYQTTFKFTTNQIMLGGIDYGK